jgi:hypothetical protein
MRWRKPADDHVVAEIRLSMSRQSRWAAILDQVAGTERPDWADRVVVVLDLLDRQSGGRFGDLDADARIAVIESLLDDPDLAAEIVETVKPTWVGLDNFAHVLNDPLLGTASISQAAFDALLSRLTGLDFYVSYFMEGPVGHTFVSFIFDNAPPLSISIETRPEMGEGFAPIASMFKQFELIYVVGSERDLVGVRDVDGDGDLVCAALPVNAKPSENHDFSIVIYPRSSKRPRSCTVAPWTTSCG